MASPLVPAADGAPDDRRAEPRADAPRRAVERVAGGPAGALPRAQVIATLAGVLLSLLLAGLDQTIVSTAGPAIQRSLAMSPALYPWITTAYLVASTVMVPIYGKLSDTYGRKPVLLVAIGIFLTGSVLCGVSPTTGTLIAARALQGLGAAGLFTSAFAVIADIFPPAVRGKYTGLVGAVFGLSSVLGPLAGGFITDHFGWHWVFFVNLPIGALAVWFVSARMPRLGGTAGAKPKLDLAGAFWLVVAVVPLLLALSVGHDEGGAGAGGAPGWASPLRLGLFGLSLAGTVLFVRTERRAADPVVDLRLFRSRVVALSIAATFVLGAGFLSAVVFLPLFMVNVAGVSATRAGLTMTPLTLGMVAGSIVSGRVVTRLGRYKKLMLGALALLFCGFALMAFTITPSSTQGELTLKMILLGLGMGPTLPLYTLAVQNATPPTEIGVVTAASTFARSLGQVFGVALVGSVFAATLASSAADETARALAPLPPAVRARVEAAVRAAPAAAGPAAADEAPSGTGFGFDAAGVRARLQAQTASGGDVGAAAAGAPSPSGAATAARGPDHAAALGAVGALEQASKRAFTAAIRRLYQTGMAFVALGFLLTAFIPGLPLRGRGAAPVPVE
jgi:EmrB/QacA subfamily drug resistance transporter